MTVNDARVKGKSDSIDAEAAARAALARDMVATPKTGTGNVEAIRALRVPRNSAVKARTQVANQIHTLIDTAPDELREQLRDRKIKSLVAEMARWRQRHRLTRTPHTGTRCTS